MGAIRPDLPAAGGPTDHDGESLELPTQRCRGVAPRSALVTGAGEQATAMGRALKERGFDLAWSGEPDWLGDARSVVEPASVDCYVQLPVPTGRVGDGVAGLHGLLSRAILQRFEAASLALPLLRSGATVLLVGGPAPDLGVGGPLGPGYDLLPTLARAIAADRLGVRAFVTGSHRRWPELAEIAAWGRLPGGFDDARPADASPDLDFAAWREEVLSLAGTDPREAVILGG